MDMEVGNKAVDAFLEKYHNMPFNSIPQDKVSAGEKAINTLLEKYRDMPISKFTSATFLDELHDAFPVLNDDIDTTFLIELLHYFPVDKVYISAGNYDQYLFDLEKTIVDNYDAGNYQVSFFYAHLIFMSYVYYCVERAYQSEPSRMEDVFYPINAYSGRKDKPDLENYNSVYDFSKIPEKEIFKVFRIMGMEHSQIRDLSTYISDRDDFAHATGKGNISVEELVQNIRTIRRHMELLNSLFLPSVKQQHCRYLLDRFGYGFDSIRDSAADYIFDSNLSIREIKYLCNLGLRRIQDENGLSKDEYVQLRKEQCAFIEFCIENYGIDIPECYDTLRDEAYLYYRYHMNADEYVEKVLGINKYRCVKDGGIFPVFDCLNCGEEQLVHDADSNSYHCFCCGQDYTDDELAFCDRCGSLMHKDENFYCDSCKEALMEKN